MKFKLLFAAILPFTPTILSAQTESTDSVAQQLDEVVVVGQNQLTNATVTTYLPSNNEKSSAQDAVDLLKRMAIPQITVDPLSNAVSTNSGQDVKIFINYIAASDQDIKGLRTKDVRKVEYLDFPTDTRFQGEPHVINIIVQEYDYGGYTKISDSYATGFGLANTGSIFSKFSYHKMTYDLYLGSSYVENRHDGNSSQSTYSLNSGTVERNQTWESSYKNYLQVPITFRAGYITPNVQIVNTVSYTFYDNYNNRNRGRLSFIPDNSGSSYTYSSSAPEINRSVYWNGQYNFSLPKDWSIGVVPTFYYGRNSSYSNYTTSITDESRIVNNAKEDAYYGRLNTSIGHRFNSNNNLRLDIIGGTYNSHVDYSGSSETLTKFSNTFTGGGLTYTLNLEKATLNADAGFLSEFLRTNGIKYDDCYPYVHISSTYSPNSRNRFNLWFQYATNSPGISERTPNVIQKNEVMYQTGNPDLANSRHITVNLSYSFFPSNQISLSAYAQYYGEYSRAVNIYERYTPTSIIQTYKNDGDYTSIIAGARLVGRFLDNSLLIQLSPQYNYVASSGYYDLTHNPVYCTAYAAYYLGAFNFSAYYQTPRHQLDRFSGTYTTTPSYYQLQVGWNKNDWNLSFTANNFARYKYDGEHTRLISPYYTSESTAYTVNYHANFELKATYTFGYGKKITRGDEVGGQSGASSAIMK